MPPRTQRTLSIKKGNRPDESGFRFAQHADWHGFFKIDEGMKTVGITNAQPRFGLPCHVYFEDFKTVSLPQQNKDNEF